MDKKDNGIRIRRIPNAVLILISVLLAACANSGTYSGASSIPSQIEQEELEELIELQKETDHFGFYYIKSDEACLVDLSDVLEENYEKITKDLNADLSNKIKVFVYKDLDTFHKAIRQENAPDWVVGIVDGMDIKMVSPLNPGKVHNYKSLIMVVVHEFTHCVVNEIASKGETIPIWLHEGVATYEANQVYSLGGINKLVKNNKIPSIESIESVNSYETMESSDVYSFSYTLVEYIIQEFGLDGLNRFIRSPNDYSGVFGMDKSQFENEWREFLKVKYD